ncbi:DIE2/ALG10 family [Popillia japonica]|uniref:Dol-P-Glc:Glc(2)Man(9)GlcNAc(2)-PP-Dol alpha-1,2-glucosyltransferase n=1 Tax=Popillia japonica TaxID=7064 RepID=A0AAW1NCB7_POPJA
MISTNSIILTVIAFYIITSYLIFYNVHSRIEKVIDEEFHIPQGLAYCNFNFSAWDPKITTLPGLYILSTIILGPLRLCSTFWLRFVNYIVGVINLCLLIILFGGFNKNANERQRLSALLSGFNLAILPPLFFFTNLYYTDVVSLMFIILLMVFNKQNKHGLASFCGLLSVIARQTNIIWVAMMSGDYILRQFYRWCIKTKPNRKLLDRISKEDVQSLRMDNLWDLLNPSMGVSLWEIKQHTQL